MPGIHTADAAIFAFAYSTLFLFFIVAPVIGFFTLKKDEKKVKKR